MRLLQRLRSLNFYERWTLICIVLAVLLRFVLIAFNWPFTDSDEGNMGLLALHVAFQGDHPIFFYGAFYLGPLEGYASAPLFRLFGGSLFLLRVPLVIFFAIFLLAMYGLLRLLYRNQRFVLLMVILLGLGSPDVLFLQLRASGEYPEIEMFAALMCLLATWLALTYTRSTLVGNWKRLVCSILLGLIIGVALWVDLLIAPFVLVAGLLLICFCWRELLRWQGAGLLGGLVVGAFPLLYYNVTAPWSQNSWFVFRSLENFSKSHMLAEHLTWLSQFTGSLLVSLPMATGGAIDCPLSAIPPTGAPGPATLPCVLFQGGWTTLYIVLLLLAACLAIFALWRYLRGRAVGGPAEVVQRKREEAIRQSGRLGLACAAGLTLVLYTSSPDSAVTPANSFRYLTCLLLALPVLLWPVWQGLGSRRYAPRWWGQALLLGVVMLTLACGMVRTLLQIPSAQANELRNETVVNDLLRIGATRVYSDYWTCNILTFTSREKVICSALDDNLNPGYDRYTPYRALVNAAPRPAYIFPAGLPQITLLQTRLNANKSLYRLYKFGGYWVYQVT